MQGVNRSQRVAGVEELTVHTHVDNRGTLARWHDQPMMVAQANATTSPRGVIRGIHYAMHPQAKRVTCVHGAVLDVAVDLRVGSPTFGEVDVFLLNDQNRRAVHIPAGVGHGFQVITGTATVVYLLTEPHTPDLERSVNPLDPALGINWPVDEPTLSDRDKAAPTLHVALESELLPGY